MERSPQRHASFEAQVGRATALAQALSHKFNLLPKGREQSWQADDPSLAIVYNLADSAGGKTGVQKYFEQEMQRISREGEAGRDTYISRLIKDLERWSQSADEILAGK